VLITKLDHSRMTPDPGMLTVAMTRVRWFEAVHFTTPLTMEYLANFKPPKHVLKEDNRLKYIAHKQFIRWQERWERVKQYSQ
jgi:hypothetical protein